MTEHRETPLLAARNLCYDADSDGARLRVLDGVDLDLYAGDICVVTGPSGAGKSTLLWALARMRAADSGDLFLNGAPAPEFKPCQWRSRVALYPQTPKLVDGDVFANLMLPWSFKVRARQTPPDRDALREGMNALGLGSVDLSRSTSELSGGQAARVALLRTLLTRPDALLLDEPTASLDEESADLVFNCLNVFAERGGTVLAVLHSHKPPTPHRTFNLMDGKLTEAAS
jgi:putative ABC transport system ATP-binding protein